MNATHGGGLNCSSTRAIEHRLLTTVAAGNVAVLTHEHGATMVMCAATASPSRTAFLVRHSSGFLQVAMSSTACDRLMIPRTVSTYGPTRTRPAQQCVGVDAARNIGTGISATDRSTTARILANPLATPGDLTRPGHLIPVAVERTARGLGIPLFDAVPIAACALMETASGNPAAVFAELVPDNDPHVVVDHRYAEGFAGKYSLPIASVEAVLTTLC